MKSVSWTIFECNSTFVLLFNFVRKSCDKIFTISRKNHFHVITACNKTKWNVLNVFDFHSVIFQRDAKHVLLTHACTNIFCFYYDGAMMRKEWHLCRQFQKGECCINTDIKTGIRHLACTCTHLCVFYTI